MGKSLLIILTAVLSISCAQSEFNTAEQASNKPNEVLCQNEDCSLYTVKQSAQNKLNQSKTDILFVFDTSQSMEGENTELANKMSGFIETLNKKGVDYNICHTIADRSVFSSTRVSNWGNGQRVLSRNTANISQVFYETVDTIKKFRGSNKEEPISATYHMIAGQLNEDCFRDNVPLEVVFLTDEDEKSCANHCKSSISNFFGAKKNKLYTANYPQNLVDLANKILIDKRLTVNPIIALKGKSDCKVGKSNEGRFHAELASLTHGIIGDICSNNYGEQLKDLSDNIERTLSSISLNCEPKTAIEITSSNGMNFKQEIRNGTLFLDPGIPVGETVKLSYDCIKE